MLRFLCVCLFVSFALAEVHEATVRIQGEGHGVITFKPTGDGLDIEGEVKGLKPGKHGFHIHDRGDISNGCQSTGVEMNPFKKHHGNPEGAERHVGDLGNIVADEHGVAKIKKHDKVISFHGETNIIGRAVVIHEKEDDFGTKNTPESKAYGDAGKFIACGVIGAI